jgi:hypothetical protein
MKAIGIFDKGLKFFYLYLSIVGIFSFSCFIFEEANQTLMFANFSCSDTHRYDLMKKNIERMAEINDHLALINKVLLCLQPIQWLAYSDFIDATQQYIESIQAEIFASDPGLYLNETVTFNFYWKSAKKTKTGYVLKAGRLSLVSKDKTINPIRVTGTITQQSSNTYRILL